VTIAADLKAFVTEHQPHGQAAEIRATPSRISL